MNQYKIIDLLLLATDLIYNLIIMGGEGSMMQMMHTLKNNKSMLNKRKERRVINGSFSGEKLEFENTSTQEDLLKIRLRLQKERKQKLIKTIIVFSCFMLLLMCVIVYFF